MPTISLRAAFGIRCMAWAGRIQGLRRSILEGDNKMSLISPSDAGKAVAIAAHLGDGATGTIVKVTRYGVTVQLESGKAVRFGFQGHHIGATGWQSNLTVIEADTAGMAAAKAWASGKTRGVGID